MTNPGIAAAASQAGDDTAEDQPRVTHKRTALAIMPDVGAGDSNMQAIMGAVGRYQAHMAADELNKKRKEERKRDAQDEQPPASAEELWEVLTAGGQRGYSLDLISIKTLCEKCRSAGLDMGAGGVPAEQVAALCDQVALREQPDAVSRTQEEIVAEVRFHNPDPLPAETRYEVPLKGFKFLLRCLAELCFASVEEVVAYMIWISRDRFELPEPFADRILAWLFHRQHKIHADHSKKVMVRKGDFVAFLREGGVLNNTSGTSITSTAWEVFLMTFRDAEKLTAERIKYRPGMRLSAKPVDPKHAAGSHGSDKQERHSHHPSAKDAELIRGRDEFCILMEQLWKEIKKDSQHCADVKSPLAICKHFMMNHPQVLEESGSDDDEHKQVMEKRKSKKGVHGHHDEEHMTRRPTTGKSHHHGGHDGHDHKREGSRVGRSMTDRHLEEGGGHKGGKEGHHSKGHHHHHHNHHHERQRSRTLPRHEGGEDEISTRPPSRDDGERKRSASRAAGSRSPTKAHQHSPKASSAAEMDTFSLTSSGTTKSAAGAADREGGTAEAPADLQKAARDGNLAEVVYHSARPATAAADQQAQGIASASREAAVAAVEVRCHKPETSHRTRLHTNAQDCVDEVDQGEVVPEPSTSMPSRARRHNNLVRPSTGSGPVQVAARPSSSSAAVRPGSVGSCRPGSSASMRRKPPPAMDGGLQHSKDEAMAFEMLSKKERLLVEELSQKRSGGGMIKTAPSTSTPDLGGWFGGTAKPCKGAPFCKGVAGLGRVDSASVGQGSVPLKGVSYTRDETSIDESSWASLSLTSSLPRSTSCSRAGSQTAARRWVGYPRRSEQGAPADTAPPGRRLKGWQNMLEPAMNVRSLGQWRYDTKVQDIKQRFEELDLDKDGLLSYDEFNTLVKRGDRIITQKETDILFRTADANGDGKVHCEEFVEFVLSAGKIAANARRNRPPARPLGAWGVVR